MKLIKILLLCVAVCCGANSVVAQTWTQTSATNNFWTSVASSADGTKLVAGSYDGGIFLTTNSGATWTQPLRFLFGDWHPTTTGVHWTSIASSADGTKLAAASVDGNGIQLSVDWGTNWGFADAPYLAQWFSIASSTDGSKLAAVIYQGGRIYTSTNFGTNWIVAGALQQNWRSIASSADGSKLVAVSANYLPIWHGGIYTSSDSGSNWTQATNVPGTNWVGVTSSTDGSKLAAVASSGPIYTSTDSGTTWTQNSAPILAWTSIASSSDGNKLVAAVNTGGIYTSTDSGTTWTSNSAPIGHWDSVASSADGNKLVAVDGNGGGIWVSQTLPLVRIGITNIGGGTNLITLAGNPNSQYVMQWSSDLSSGTWTDLQTNTTDINGQWLLFDSQDTNTVRFYRSVSH